MTDFSKKILGRTLLGMAAISGASAWGADAETALNPGFQFGIGLGSSELHFASRDLGLSDHTSSGLGFTVFAGYRILRYLAVEAAYIDGSNLSKTWSDTTGSETGSMHPHFEQLSALGIYPLNKDFSVFVRVGADRWDGVLKDVVTDQTGTVVSSASASSNKTSFAWGVGGTAFVDGAQLRLEYQQSKANVSSGGAPPIDLQGHLVMLSIVWLF